ncbi:TrmJ/YjtD family RNA methyltransferase [Candidatus Binatia bacterium]|nr:TrmJ/YjtD family RNA methyltransferase [Candidatus Binatia bacterium]
MPLRNIRVVLVRPRGAANVGAAARAMKNMGLTELVLVAPRLGGRLPAAAMAVHAADVLAGRRTVATLHEAVADCGLVVGTTRRDGPYRAGAEEPRRAAPRWLAAAERNRVALVFGPEDHGLSNDDLAVCHQLTAIPADAAYASLNLAQAVMLCCYELFLAANGGAEAVSPPELATADRVEQAMTHLRAAFLSIGFLHRDNPDHIMFAFRRMFGRAGLDERDVRILLGLARQIEWFGRDGWRLRGDGATEPAGIGAEG